MPGKRGTLGTADTGVGGQPSALVQGLPVVLCPLQDPYLRVFSVQRKWSGSRGHVAWGLCLSWCFNRCHEGLSLWRDSN